MKWKFWIKDEIEKEIKKPRLKNLLPDQKMWDRKLLLSDPPNKESKASYIERRETKYAVAEIEEEIHRLQDNWASGGYSRETIDETLQKETEARGRIRGLFFARSFLTKDEEEE